MSTFFGSSHLNSASSTYSSIVFHDFGICIRLMILFLDETKNSNNIDSNVLPFCWVIYDIDKVLVAKLTIPAGMNIAMTNEIHFGKISNNLHKLKYSS